MLPAISGRPARCSANRFTALGDEVVDAQLYPYDHLPGGVLVWPQPKSATRAITVQRAGKSTTLSRAAASW